MANWNNNHNPEKDLASIGALFETGKVKRMYDIAELYPTKIIKLLGINSERYSLKLAEPEKFSVSEILRLAYLFNIDPNLMINIIQTEVEIKIIAKIKNK